MFKQNIAKLRYLQYQLAQPGLLGYILSLQQKNGRAEKGGLQTKLDAFDRTGA